MKISARTLFATIACAVLSAGCSRESATFSSSATETSVVHKQGSDAQALNASPVLRMKSSPAMTAGNPYPVVSGAAPLKVTFNLCPSEDADPGDSLNWQFHFGDDDTQPFRADGSFNPSVDHSCRVEHTYSAGSYVATLSVTDKHVEDQSRAVSALARKTERLTIQALNVAPAGPDECLVIKGTPTFRATRNSPGTLTCQCDKTLSVLNFFTGFAPACFAPGVGGTLATYSNGGNCTCD